MEAALSSQTHSSDVEIWLSVNGNSHEVAQLGPDFLILRHRQGVELSPCPATISLRVDDADKSWQVRLTEGVSPNRVRTPLSSQTVAVNPTA